MTPIETDALTHPDLRAIESAPGAGSAGILAGSEAAQPLRTNIDCGTKSHPLPQILSHMQTLATLCAKCAKSTRTRPASSETATATPIDTTTAATSLIATMEKLLAAAAEPAWHALAPPIHYLDWQLRMLPPQSPEQTFGAYANAYASAARILQTATRNATTAATQRSSIEIKKNEIGNERTEIETNDSIARGPLQAGREGDRCLVR
jgi:hypothetical protein